MKKYNDLLIKVKGFLDEIEGMSLYDTALKAGKIGPCLEIGSYCGKSTIYLGAACKENDEILFSIDHHRGSEEQQPGEEYYDPDLFDDRIGQIDTFKFFRKTIEMAEMSDVVVPIVSNSSVAAKSWKTPLSLVFIDGGHSFEAALTDYNCWSEHIISGGFLLIHDIFPDPIKGGQAPYEIYKKAIASGKFEKIQMVKTLGILRRI